jgi:hypothetical protein
MRRRHLAALTRIVLAAALVVAAPMSASSQAPVVPADTTAPVLKWWATLALGPGNANGRGRLGGDIGVWVTRDKLAIWVRDATAARLLEAGDFYDLSVLAGIHPLTSEHLDFVAGLGAGISRGHGTGGENLPSEPVLAAGAQLNLNYRVVGIGLDGFATLGSSRWYYGIGLAVAAGWFR